MKIGNVEIENPIVIAPMAGVTNPAFREICKKFKAGLVCTEMVSDKAICFENKKTLSMTAVNENEHPLSMQLFGHDMDTMLKAALYLDTQTDCDIIDINMGCPVNKIVKANAGSALMRDEDYAAELVQKIVAHVKKPVTVKMRIGWDSEHKNCVSLAKKLEKAGISAVAVHGRTKKQMYEGKADWTYIKAVKDAISIPVIGNGDVRSVEDMIQMMKETHCDMVMIGRGILGDPWLIQHCLRYLETGEIKNDIRAEEKFKLAMEHAKSLCALKGERVGMKEMRTHAAWYIKSLKYSHRIKDLISGMETLEEFGIILENYQKSLDDDNWYWLERQG